MAYHGSCVQNVVKIIVANTFVLNIRSAATFLQCVTYFFVLLTQLLNFYETLHNTLVKSIVLHSLTQVFEHLRVLVDFFQQLRNFIFFHQNRKWHIDILLAVIGAEGAYTTDDLLQSSQAVQEPPFQVDPDGVQLFVSHKRSRTAHRGNKHSKADLTSLV